MRFTHLMLSATVFALLAGAVLHNLDAERQRLREELRTEVASKVTTKVTRLSSELNANVFLANGLIGHITASPDIDDREMNTALRTLYKFGRHLRNIGIAPGNRVSHVYPLQGNRAAIGLYYPDEPNQWPSVERAIARHTTVLAGPVQLRQGGMGLISRTPVYLEDGSYWGMISLVLRPSSLFAAAGLSPDTDGVRIAMRGTDGLGPDGAVFFGDSSLFRRDAVLITMAVPGGTWQIAAYPVGGWETGQRKIVLLSWAGVAGCGLIALALLAYLRDRERIDVSQKRLAAILRTTPDGVILVDRAGVISEFNPAAERLFGYPASEVLGGSIQRLLPPDEHAPEKTLLSPGVSRCTGRRSDGRTFPLEVTVGESIIAGQPLRVGVLRDVSERVALDERLRRRASTDDLTGALNRRAFLETAEHTFAVARRHARPLSLLMMDADHFKTINDSYGHETGDRVLTRLAAITMDSLRTSDQFCRFGGEEFVALLPETDARAACELARRLLRVLRNTEVEATDGRKVRFTVSVGIADLSGAPQDLTELIRRADAALYRAKGEGRDRCVTDRG